ncbi:MAG: putative nucleic acid-binding protein [Pseudolabrys sp.]|jgi:predicted RNA-binding protein YlxR (DUF448 family)|nr:putative nucleic acid-binding protein [Pseudolabrys sp.]
MLATASDNELDRGPVATGGERTCALTRQTRPAEDLIRFVVGPAGDVVPDVKRKLPGRGLWIGLSRAAVDEAVRRRVFSRGFKREVKVDPELGALTERLLEQSALDALAIAGKAGGVVTGFAKVEAALAGDVLALIHAQDAAEDGKRKLATALRRRGEDVKVPVIEVFSSAQLDLALDRINVVHAALLNGPASSTFLARTERFIRFRTGNSAEAATGLDGTAPATASLTREEN